MTDHDPIRLARRARHRKPNGKRWHGFTGGFSFLSSFAAARRLASGFAPLWAEALVMCLKAEREMTAASAVQLAEIAAGR